MISVTGMQEWLHMRYSKLVQLISLDCLNLKIYEKLSAFYTIYLLSFSKSV